MRASFDQAQPSAVLQPLELLASPILPVDAALRMKAAAVSGGQESTRLAADRVLRTRQATDDANLC